MTSLMWYFVGAIVAGYFLGCIQSGFFIGKIAGLDIRQYGSGNAGTTNVLRTLGKSRALCTFLGDALKGFIPVLVVKYLMGPSVPELNSELLQLVIGFAVVMGHDYPFFLNFRGGKGIATTAAVMMAFDWRIGLCCFVIFVTVVALTRYVSLASILLSLGLLVEMFVFHPGRWDLLAVTVLYTFFAVYRHRANIKRLLAGTESKLGQKVEVK
ncbi:MAG: glycerol-3-phosphate 1-O-acyltransferase PlsY [Eubacteriales bacterium]|nr:glycerol-3-phosphate 1-O-acyltransferase PlsY [Eubacteriales bacterium]